MGEGLVYAALGPTSPVARDKWTQTEDSFKASIYIAEWRLYDIKLGMVYLPSATVVAER